MIKSAHQYQSIVCVTIMAEGKDSVFEFLNSCVFLLLSLLTFYLVLSLNQPEDIRSHGNAFEIVQKESVASLLQKEVIPLTDIGAKSFTKPKSFDSEKEEKIEVSEESSQERLTRQLARAKDLSDQGLFLESSVILQDILKDHPEHEQSLIELGMIKLINEKSPRLASEYLERALRVNPDNRAIMAEIYEIYEELGDMPSGLSFMQNLYDEHPDNFNLATGLSMFLAHENRKQEASQILETMVTDSQKDVSLQDVADLYSQIGLNQKALDLHQTMIEQEKDKIETGYYAEVPEHGRENLALAYLGKVSELVEQKKYEEAESLIENKVKTLYKGNFEQVIEIFEKSSFNTRSNLP